MPDKGYRPAFERKRFSCASDRQLLALRLWRIAPPARTLARSAAQASQHYMPCISTNNPTPNAGANSVASTIMTIDLASITERPATKLLHTYRAQSPLGDEDANWNNHSRSDSTLRWAACDSLLKQKDVEMNPVSITVFGFSR